MGRVAYLIALPLILAACTTQQTADRSTPIDPTQFRAMSCDQLAEELLAIEANLFELSRQQEAAPSAEDGRDIDAIIATLKNRANSAKAEFVRKQC